jgi:hypothetical protein
MLYLSWFLSSIFSSQLFIYLHCLFLSLLAMAATPNVETKLATLGQIQCPGGDPRVGS